MENLGFLVNSRICKNEEEQFPLGALYRRRSLVGVAPLKIQKKETKSYRRDESRSNSNETLKPLDPHRIIEVGNMDP